MRTEARKPRLDRARIAICVILLLLIVGLGLFFRHTTTMLSGQQAAARWGGDVGRFAQVTAFLPEYGGLTRETVDSVRHAIKGELTAQSLEPNTPEGAPAFAYSAQGVLTVRSRDRIPVEVYATGVGGNFSLFHPVQLSSGAMLPPMSVNQDLVLIDETLAWRLFGATDVAGLELFIGDAPHFIIGVYRPFEDFASRAATGTMPHMFLYYDTMAEMVGSAPITTVETVLPNPISGIAEAVLLEALDNVLAEDAVFELMNNTDRYNLSALLGVVRNFGRRSMYQTGLRLPDWENAARMAEDFAALALVLMLLLALYPAFIAIRLGIWHWRRRKWRLWRYVYRKFTDKREQRREAKWESTRPVPAEVAPVPEKAVPASKEPVPVTEEAVPVFEETTLRPEENPAPEEPAQDFEAEAQALAESVLALEEALLSFEEGSFASEETVPVSEETDRVFEAEAQALADSVLALEEALLSFEEGSFASEEPAPVPGEEARVFEAEAKVLADSVLALEEALLSFEEETPASEEKVLVPEEASRVVEAEAKALAEAILALEESVLALEEDQEP